MLVPTWKDELLMCETLEFERRTQISAIDISRAYFNASMEDGAEPTYVMLPPEHPDYAKNFCGLLKRHMYGTRAAADG